MEYVYIILKILGGMGALLIGMKMLSENLTRLAHNKLQTLLNKTAKNRFACVGIGTAVTVIGQSSAFTTVMVVGLVNAGIMTLFQATAMIMGANVGTTLVTWIVSLTGLSGAEIDITMFFLACAAVGALMLMISKKEKIKSIGSALAGFGLIFVGLMVMKNAFPVDGAEADVIKNIFGAKIHPILLLLIGIALTALLQSSTAVNAIIISMTATGIMIGGGAGNALYFVIIGTNIGTCITALISSIGANPNAKRAALIHFLFNFFGAIIFTIILLAWKGFADTLLTPAFPNNPEMRIALFHTIFNVIGTMIFLPFINLFVKLANLIVRDKKKEEEALPLAELDERLLNSPSVALNYLYQETGKIFTYAMNILNLSFGAFLKKDTAVKEKVTEQNGELFAANKKVVSYLIKLSATHLSMGEEKTVSSLHYVLNDIMRIGELADNVTKYTGHYVNDNLVFSQEFLTGLEAMYEKIKNLYVLSLATYLFRDRAKLKEVDAQEDEIDKDRRTLVATHIERLNEGKCQPQNSSVFINLVGNLERAADHINYIAHSIEQSAVSKGVLTYSN
ncbi:MAG: Na/Pi cotransporter family protein [Clostridia bacterium]|nr:Na/Pi cotransporter family protein [Clostridia bacterium]